MDIAAPFERLAEALFPVISLLVAGFLLGICALVGMVVWGFASLVSMRCRRVRRRKDLPVLRAPSQVAHHPSGPCSRILSPSSGKVAA